MEKATFDWWVTWGLAQLLRLRLIKFTFFCRFVVWSIVGSRRRQSAGNPGTYTRRCLQHYAKLQRILGTVTWLQLLTRFRPTRVCYHNLSPSLRCIERTHGEIWMLCGIFMGKKHSFSQLRKTENWICRRNDRTLRETAFVLQTKSHRVISENPNCKRSVRVSSHACTCLPWSTCPHTFLNVCVLRRHFSTKTAERRLEEALLRTPVRRRKNQTKKDFCLWRTTEPLAMLGPVDSHNGWRCTFCHRAWNGPYTPGDTCKLSWPSPHQQQMVSKSLLCQRECVPTKELIRFCV